MRLRGRFYDTLPFLLAPDGGSGSGGGSGDGNNGVGNNGGGNGDARLPPSRHDAPLGDEQKFDRAYVQELRNENKTWRQQLAEERRAREAADNTARTASEAAEAAKKAAEDAAKAAEGRVKTRETEIKTEADRRVMRAEIKAAAKIAGIVDLDGLQFVDYSLLKFDDKGEVQGIDEAVKKLKESKPYLFGNATGSTRIGADGKPAAAGNGTTFDARTADKKDYEAERARVAPGYRRRR